MHNKIKIFGRSEENNCKTDLIIDETVIKLMTNKNKGGISVQNIIIAGLILLSLGLLVKLFFSPMRFFVKLILNTLVGFIWLAVFNFIGGNLLGFTLGFNLVNSLIVGVFGLPGFVLLLLVRIILI